MRGYGSYTQVPLMVFYSKLYSFQTFMALKTDWPPSLMLLSVLLTITLLHLQGVEFIGVCYGLNGDNLPSRQDVINHYISRNIQAMRLYFPDQQALEALRGSNIELILDVPGENLESIATHPVTASQWVQTNILNFYPSVKIKYISVGNEVNPVSSVARFVLPAMKNIRDALESSGLQNQIKVSIAIWSALLSDAFPPSNGRFRDDIRSYVDPIVEFLASNGSPLLANIYPFFSYIGNPKDILLSYALFTSPNAVVTDPNNGLMYQNLFDALVDSIYAALTKVNGANVPIVVSETGWPSNGHLAATQSNAETYLTGLINHVEGGTPWKREPIESYIFAMFDENLKNGDEVEQHFGLFTPDRQPKYSNIP